MGTVEERLDVIERHLGISGAAENKSDTAQSAKDRTEWLAQFPEWVREWCEANGATPLRPIKWRESTKGYQHEIHKVSLD